MSISIYINNDIDNDILADKHYISLIGVFMLNLLRECTAVLLVKIRLKPVFKIVSCLKKKRKKTIKFCVD